MNRGIVRLLVGEAEEALADFLTARSLPPKACVVNEFVGTALWRQGQHEAACQDWENEIRRRRSRELTHTDEAGGVLVPALLWWASQHSGLNHWQGLADEELRHRWRTKACQRSLWPGTLVPFLLGHTSEQELLAAASERAGILQVRRRCQAHFYSVFGTGVPSGSE